MGQESDDEGPSAVPCSLDIFLYIYFYVSLLAGTFVCAPGKKKGRV